VNYTPVRRRASAFVSQRMLAVLLVAAFAFFAMLQPSRFILWPASAQVAKKVETGASVNVNKIGPVRPLISIGAVNTPVTENFDTLSSTTASSTVPAGWAFIETGTNANTTYSVGTGSSTTADTYSFGAASSSERAFGGLRSGSLVPTIGAFFTNNTGTAITSLRIAYAGEQWRLGATGRNDRLDFQYSTDATSLTTGTWTDADNLDFVAPISTGSVGLLDGNSAANRKAIDSFITNLNIPAGSTFWIRWTDFDAAGSDDGLAVDDFSLTANPPIPALTINDVTHIEGNSGTTTYTFNVSLSQAALAGGVTFDIATADGTATTASGDYVAKSLTSQTIPQGSSNYTFDVTVNGDTTIEPDETFFVNVTNVAGSVFVADGQGVGTILDDDRPITPIYSIQGSGSTSPVVGQVISTTGIVTGKKSNGFYIQDPLGDSDPNTSDGVFVFTSSSSPAVGSSVKVTGTVQEFIPPQDLAQKPVTEIGGSVSVSLLSTGNQLPAPAIITAADTTSVDTFDNLERFEGMRVQVNSLTVIAPTGGSITEPSATVSSNGEFFGVVAGVARPFREPGVNASDPLPSGAPNTVPRFDENPERLRVDSNAQPGTAIVNIPAGMTLTNVVGELDFTFRAWTILPETTITPGTLPTAAPVPTPTNNEFTVASFNMERFFNNVVDAGESGAPKLTDAAYAGRLNKASLIIRTIQRYPDVIGVEEMENLATLTDVANQVNNDAQTIDHLPNPQYTPYLVEGNDVGGIDVGFLVKQSRINVVDVTQFGKTTTFSNPDSSTSLLNDRPPLVLRATINRPAGLGALAFTVIVNHLRSLNNIDDTTAGTNGWPTEGDRVRAKRRAQAEFLANLIQSRQTADPTERIISVGDYNAFNVNDGYVDVIGTIKGTPAPASQVTLASPDLVNPDLTDLVDTLPAAQRYSYSFDGNAQTLDHQLLNPNAMAILTRFAYARDDADFPVNDYANPSVPQRISDHDQPVAFFSTVPVTQAGQLIISEFRLSGPGGPNDEFVEIYNNTFSDILVNATDGSSGYALVASDNSSRFVIPNGTTIPARGHYLGVNSAGYSLGAYPSGNSGGSATTATGDATYTADIPNNAGLALFNTSNAANFTLANRLDAVGFTSVSDTLYREGAGLPPLSIFDSEYSFYRDMASTGLPQDSNDNASDFRFVDTQGTSAGAGQRLGAPGPENLTSPVNRGATIKGSLIDPGCTGPATVPTQACPRYRDSTPSPGSPTSANGTLSLRRRFTNNTGQPVTRLRFRIVDVTTFPQAQVFAGTADVRAITSSDQPAFCQGTGGGCTSVGSPITINGTTLESPPAQPIGGGYNSTLSVGTITFGTPLAAGDSLNVQFLLGVQTPGSFRFFVIIEALPNLTSVAIPSASPVDFNSAKGAGQSPANNNGTKNATGGKRAPVFKEN
jgi:predicted extracellular nuclease